MEIQRYLLLSSKNSYTDFHIDFSGTAVWYHIKQGKKLFLLIPFNTQYINKWWEWEMSEVDELGCKKFFPDFINTSCYLAEVKQGDTLILPSGWIHAVYTPEDSIVVGGNFFHFMSMKEQVYCWEKELLHYNKLHDNQYIVTDFQLLTALSLRYYVSLLNDNTDSTKINTHGSNNDNVSDESRLKYEVKLKKRELQSIAVCIHSLIKWYNMNQSNEHKSNWMQNLSFFDNFDTLMKDSLLIICNNKYIERKFKHFCKCKEFEEFCNHNEIFYTNNQVLCDKICQLLIDNPEDQIILNSTNKKYSETFETNALETNICTVFHLTRSWQKMQLHLL